MPKIRAGEKFLSWREKQKQKFNLSDTQLTDSLACFMEEENLTQWFDQKVKSRKKRKRGSWF